MLDLVLIALLHRDPQMVERFRETTICPSTGRYGRCPGYIVDHIVPLVCKGADHPANMQYQTVKESRFKDRWERACARPSDQE